MTTTRSARPRRAEYVGTNAIARTTLRSQSGLIAQVKCQCQNTTAGATARPKTTLSTTKIEMSAQASRTRPAISWSQQRQSQRHPFARALASQACRLLEVHRATVQLLVGSGHFPGSRGISRDDRRQASGAPDTRHGRDGIAVLSARHRSSRRDSTSSRIVCATTRIAWIPWWPACWRDSMSWRLPANPPFSSANRLAARSRSASRSRTRLGWRGSSSSTRFPTSARSCACGSPSSGSRCCRGARCASSAALTAWRMHSRHTHRADLQRFLALMRADDACPAMSTGCASSPATTCGGGWVRFSRRRSFLASSDDHLVPAVEQARLMARAVPRAAMRVLDGHGHICLIAPDLNLLEIIDEWQAGLESNARTRRPA